MKNFIDYYYNFNINNILFNNGSYFFYDGSNKYMLKQIENNKILDQQIELSYQLSDYQHFFLIVRNKENSYITWIENKPYVLLKLSKIENDKISIFDIKTDLYVTVTSKNAILNHYPWIKLWENKIDYFENWFSMKYDSYRAFFPLFHFFIGIAENALLYLKESEKEEVNNAIRSGALGVSTSSKEIWEMKL